ncbi:MAG: glutathione S-transferase, partial [Gammaproteobacteria bacterium]
MTASRFPVLYSFRRCPYAMRARLALANSQIQVELREIVLRNKPQQLIDISPKATVPVLITADGTVIDESIDIMRWGLDQHDPDNWYNALTQSQQLL